MPKTRITVAFEIPTTSMSRVQDVMGPIKEVVDSHKGSEFFVTIQGPIPDISNEAKTNGKRTEDSEDRNEQRSVGGRSEAGRAEDADGSADGDDKPKRGRGRPRKSDGDAEASGSASRKRQRDAEDADGSEGIDGDEPKRARKGSDEGSRQGEGGSRGSGRGGQSERGNREEARLDEGDDWGDEEGDGDGDFEEDDAEAAAAKSSKAWPDSLTPDDSEIDKPYVTKLLGDHYNATGGKDRTLTFDLMEDVTGTRKLAEIDEGDYRGLVKALLKDIARYKHGVKKAK